MGTQEFCLHWKNHHSNMSAMFSELLLNETMVDVTLACEGSFIKAHKIILSACSPFFKSVFIENPCKHPTIILKDMKYHELKAIIEFMYHGELVIAKNQISSLIDVAQNLMVKGLSEVVAQENLASDQPTKSPNQQNHKKKNKGNKRLHQPSTTIKDEVEPPTKKNFSKNSAQASGSNSTATSNEDAKNDAASDKEVSSEISANNDTNNNLTDNATESSNIKEEPPSDAESLTNNNELKDKDNPIENNLELVFEEDQSNAMVPCSPSQELQVSDVQELATIFLARTPSKRHYPLNIPGIHSPSKIPPTVGKKYPSRVCRMCPGRRETRWECAKCSVALHPQDCFDKFHQP